MKKSYLIWPTAFITGLYRTFVLECCWNWFAVPFLGVPGISYWGMFGINLLITLFFPSKNEANEYRWEILTATVETCVPEDRKEDLKNQLEAKYNDTSSRIIKMIFSELIGNTFVLVLGWCVAVFLL